MGCIDPSVHSSLKRNAGTPNEEDEVCLLRGSNNWQHGTIAVCVAAAASKWNDMRDGGFPGRNKHGSTAK